MSAKNDEHMSSQLRKKLQRKQKENNKMPRYR